MNISPPYKQIIAGLLLLLYVFIATPVQYWHHHNYPVPVKISTSKQHTSFQKSTGQASDANCAVCSHQYAVYNEAIAISFEVVLPVSLYSYSTYKVSTFKSLVLHSSNKGPPTIG